MTICSLNVDFYIPRLLHMPRSTRHFRDLGSEEIQQQRHIPHKGIPAEGDEKRYVLSPDSYLVWVQETRTSRKETPNHALLLSVRYQL